MESSFTMDRCCYTLRLCVRDVLRLRAARTGKLPEDASWAVLPAARLASTTVTQDDDSRSVGFHTASLRVSVDRSTGLLTLRDLAGAHAV
jgi:alpha-glucosidase